MPDSWFFATRGVDCINFVSQSLYIGEGWPQRGTDYWTVPYQWYFNGVFSHQHSASWSSVIEFGNFVVTSQRGRETSFARSDVWVRPTQFTTGDIMQADWTGDGTWDHTMIITDIDGSDVYITQHSDNLKDKRVSEIIRQCHF